MTAARPDGRSGRARATAAAAAALLAGAVALAACTHHPAVTRPYPPPTAAELAATLAAHHAAVRSMNARARATSWLGGQRVRATVLMLVARDGHLRFEAEVSLQGTVATLVTDGTSFALYDAQKNELRRGPACPANVASLVRIPLAPVEVAAILLGDVDLAGAEPGDSVAWDPDRGADAWVVPLPVGRARVFFRGTGAERALVGALREDRAGHRLWQTAYEDFEVVGAVRLPRLIRFAERDASFDDGVEVKFKDRTVGGKLAPESFMLAPPPGATVHDVGCGS